MNAVKSLMGPQVLDGQTQNVKQSETLIFHVMKPFFVLFHI